MKYYFLLLAPFLIACSDEAPKSEVLKKVYIEKVAPVKNNQAIVEGFSVKKKTLLKNNFPKDHVNNIKMSVDLNVKILAKEKCKLRKEQLYLAYENFGMSVVPKNAYDAYSCLNEKDIEVSLGEIKSGLDKKIGEKNYDHCGAFSFACNPQEITKEDVDQMYLSAKAKYMEAFIKDLNAGDIIFEGEQKMIVNSGPNGEKTEQWSVSSLEAINTKTN